MFGIHEQDGQQKALNTSADEKEKLNMLAQRPKSAQSMATMGLSPKLDLLGRLIPDKTTAAEMGSQEIFFGKGHCASCR